MPNRVSFVTITKNSPIKFRLVKLVFIIACSLTSYCANSQPVKFNFKENKQTETLKEILYKDTIWLNCNKTVLIDIKGINLKGVDIGSPKSDILIGQQDSTSIILLKARKKNFAETNLSIFGEDTTFQFIIRYKDNPTKTYFTYSLPSSKKDNISYNQVAVDTAKIVEMANKKEDAATELADKRSPLEKQAKVLINPKNKLFTAMRSKNQNINAGDIERGVRVYLQKLYKSGDNTYFGFKVANFSMGDFQLSGFEIKKVDGEVEQPLTIINEESAYNFLKRFEKVDFIAIADNVELNSTSKLIFSFTSEDKGTAFKFTLNTKDFQKREAL